MDMLPDTWLCSVLDYGDFNFTLKDMEDCIELDSTCVNKVDRFGQTPLFYALVTEKCPVDVIKLLLSYGADANFKESSDRTILHVAVEYNRDESVISLLLEHGANVLDVFNGQSVLCIALHNGASKGVVQLLLDAGCLLNGCEAHHSALHCAVEDPYPTLNEDVVRLLIERGADMNVIDRYGRSVMCHALYRCTDVSAIEILLAAGISLSACAKHASPLLCVTDSPYVECYLKKKLNRNLIKFLLHKGAPLDRVDSDGLTPLQGALKSCYYETGAISLLFHHLPDVDVVDGSNNNLLDLALQNPECCELLVVKLLIERGVRIDNVNVKGQTALHQAANNRLCCPCVIKLLLKNGAAVNAKNDHGEIPLEFTVNSRWNLSKIRVLLAAGAHVGVVRNGQSLLKKVLDKYEDWKYQGLGIFQIVLKYSLLENPNFSIEGLIEGHKESETFAKYWRDCVDELQKMESVTVGDGCTLLEFLNEYSRKEAVNCKPEEKNYDFNQLLRIKANNLFPLFSDVISDKVDRWIMNAKLEEILVYTMKYTPHKACKGEKNHYGSVCEIVQYLLNDDLFSLIVAFTYTDEDSKEEKMRIAKGSTKCRNHRFKAYNSAALYLDV